MVTSAHSDTLKRRIEGQRPRIHEQTCRVYAYTYTEQCSVPMFENWEGSFPCSHLEAKTGCVYRWDVALPPGKIPETELSKQRDVDETPCLRSVHKSWEMFLSDLVNLFPPHLLDGWERGITGEMTKTWPDRETERWLTCAKLVGDHLLSHQEKRLHFPNFLTLLSFHSPELMQAKEIEMWMSLQSL